MNGVTPEKLRQQTREQVAVMNAFIHGHQIETRYKDRPGTWVQVDYPAWEWGEMDYRVRRPPSKFEIGEEVGLFSQSPELSQGVTTGT